MPITKKEIDSKIEMQKKTFLNDYKTIVETPSISAIAAHKKDIEQTAETAVRFLKNAGATVAKIVKTKGNPVVFGRIENKKGAPTIAVYNHLDVQPAVKGKDGWTREPFTFAEEKGRFYSRGTTDDKGPAMTALWAAKLAKELGVPTNVEFIWEFEEEIGSPNFAEFIDKTKGEILAKSVLVSDTLWLNPKVPSITNGLRGLVTMVVRLRTGKKDVHSGVVGGAARNPIAELCEIVSKCVNAKTGEILIPGFDQTWKKPSSSELEEYVRSGFTTESFKQANELTSMRTDKVEDVISRIWLSPTFEVHGFSGGYQEQGVKTIVPQFAELKVSCRLVPNQNPDEIFKLFKDYVKKLNPDCEVLKEGALFPYAATSDTNLIKNLKESLNFGFGLTPAPVREGGSIGAVVTMKEKLNVPIMFMGLSLPEDGYHGPDESFAWTQIEGGTKAFAKYFELLSDS